MNWAPRNYAICAGQFLSITGNEALFSLIGTKYGGDGITNFALPDFRGRVPVGMGQGIGLTPCQLGQIGGSEYSRIQLSESTMPAHTHELTGTTAVIPGSEVEVKMQVSTDLGERSEAQANDYLGETSKITGKSVNLYRGDATNSVEISGGSSTIPQHTVSVEGNVSPAGQGKPFSVPLMQPYLGMNYIICVKGIYPQRE